MKIVFLDGYTTQKGDIDDSCLYSLGNYQMYDRTMPDQLEERVADADILITNKFVIDSNSLAHLPNLKYIVVAATGYNNIDINAVKDRNIPVSNVVAYSTTSVVQQAFASLLEVLNKPAYYHDQVRNQRWSSCPDFCFYDHSVRELSDMTLGIIGFGQIGSKMAAVAQAFGMNVLAYSRTEKTIPNIQFVTNLDQLWSNSDVISLHLPLSPQSKEMINTASLMKMKKNAILINTGRGPLIAEADLANHLKSHPVFTAILDVLTTEPPSAENPLVGLSNCHITPHIAWASAKARQNLVNGIAQNITEFLSGSWINRVYEAV